MREDGQTYYAEAKECDRMKACEWVWKNVMPHLDSAAIKPRAQIRDEIADFCGIQPEFWAYYCSYDWLCLCQLYGRMLDVPSDWPNFCFDLQQLRMLMGGVKLLEQTSVQHNALTDAVWTRDAWFDLVNRK